MKKLREILHLPADWKDLDMFPLVLSGKLINNRYLWAIRQSFFRIIPFMLAISFFEIIISIFLDPNGFILGSRWLNLGFWLTGGMTGDAYQQHYIVNHLMYCRHIVGMGYGVLSLILVLSLSGQLADIWEVDKSAASFCAMAAFLFMLPPVSISDQATLVDYFAERRFFAAFFDAFAATWLFAFLCRQKWMKMPSFPRATGSLGKYLALAGPISLTLLSFAMLALLTEREAFSLEYLMHEHLSPEIFQMLPLALLYQFAVWSLWWLGIPGFGFTSGLQRFAYVSAQNTNQLGDSAYTFTSGFFEAGMMHTLGLIIAVLIFSRHTVWRQVAKWCLPLAVFNIQEPLVFGLPIVLNPLFLVPYILTPLANTVIGYVAITWGIVPIFKVSMPWTMPLIVSGILGTGSFMGGVLQAVWLVTDIFIYVPFVLLANVIDLEEDKLAAKSAQGRNKTDNQNSGIKRGETR